MSYLNYGIDRDLVERIKLKLKNPVYKERVKNLMNGVTKADLQNPNKVSRLLSQTAAALGEKLTAQQADGIIRFVIAQKIDPSNTFHLIKLWGMFR
ncbi:stage VI sporulation protein F [Paenibacillus aurantius]|uniref:Stage VI sporulation protein F n=1 Tax=Paenibacillus aurantius TaxID=2918900 RepID=A0AA96LLV3_9BACL|nr:stage VI sporulation protein F [Paenibacillus aurantius]WJH33225.1 stage VI sporulation protein F [Paenibacillus sp. CC-CFT747]WNQ13682.1 stage VI sporulation protein F [Paenibacillus aurantius]